MKLKKLASHAILIQLEKIEKTHTGVYVPDDNVVSEKAEVLQVAKDVTECEKGDIVLFKSYAPDYFDLDGEEYAILDERNVRAVL